MGVTVKELEVVFDFGWGFAQQVWLHRLDHCFCGPLPAVDPSLTDPDRPVFAMNFDK